MIPVHKDEVKYLKKMGLGKYITAKTCYGKSFAEEDNRVLEALKKYKTSYVTEAKYGRY